MSPLTEVILATIREHLYLAVTMSEVAGPDGSPVWRAEAHNAAGETWAAEHEEEYMAAVMLAELVGMELEE